MGFLEQARARQARRSSGRLASGVLAFAMMAGLSVAGIAPAAAQGSSGGIETVTVTAQYTQQNIQATPLSISAVTGQDLEQRGIQDLASLQTSVPSLTLTKEPAAFGSGVRVYIRGIGQYDTAFASEPGVGMYVDDEYYGTLFGSNLELLDLNRIEILRGPQGVLGGKNNIGGAIRLFTKKPTGDGSGYLQASYGSFNEIDVKGALDVSIIPDHLFARVTAMSRHQDGFMKVIDYACAHPATAGSLPVLTTHPDCTVGTLGGTNVQGARLELRAIFNSRIEDNLAVEVIRDNSETQAGSLIVADSQYCDTSVTPTCPGVNVAVFRNGHVMSVPRAAFYGLNSDGAIGASGTGIATWNGAINVPTYGIPWDQRFIPADPYRQTYATYTSMQGNHYTDGARVHTWSINNIFDWDILDNLHFKNITGFRQYNAGNSNDSDLSPMSYQLTTSYPTNREFQEEARFTGKLFDNHLDWTAGFFYYHRTNTQSGAVDIEGALAPFLVFEQHDKYVTTNKSAYLNLIYHVWDDLDVFGGVRYTSEEKTFYFDHSMQVPGYPFSGFFRSTVNPLLDCNIFVGHLCDHTINPPLLGHTSRTARPDWRAGVQYQITDDKMVYFSFSTGYRTGGTNSRPFTPAQLDSYGPETLKSYEVGAKTDWFHHRLRVNVSLYTADYTNIITPTTGTDPYLPGILPYVKYVNLASANDEGFEIEAFVNPIDNMLIDASVSYTHFTANPVPGAPAGWLDGCSAAGYAGGLCDANPMNLGFAPHASPGTTRVGSSPILFPETTFHIGAQYAISLNGAGTLTPRLDYSWQSTVYQDANNNPYTALKSRGLLDGRITWDAPEGGWQVALSASNLTDERYFLNVFNLAIFGQGSVEGQPGAPREFLLTVRKNF